MRTFLVLTCSLALASIALGAEEGKGKKKEEPKKNQRTLGKFRNPPEKQRASQQERVSQRNLANQLERAQQGRASQRKSEKQAEPASQRKSENKGKRQASRSGEGNGSWQARESRKSDGSRQASGGGRCCGHEDQASALQPGK